MASDSDFIVMGVDPGLMTGVCLVNFGRDREDPVLMTSKEIEFPEVMLWCSTFMPEAQRLVAERFIITPKTGKNSQAPWSLETLGVVRAMSLDNDLELELQSAAEAKSTVDNPMIKRLGLWHRGGKGHALDAIRHATTYAIRKGWRHRQLLPSDA